MPNARNANSIPVVATPGAGDWLGVIDAKIGMLTNEGTIVNTNGSGMFYLGDVSGWRYNHLSYVTSGHAMSVWSFPTGDNSVTFGEAYTWPNGVPKASGNITTYLDGGGAVHNFVR